MNGRIIIAKAATEMNGRIIIAKPPYVALTRKKEGRKTHLASQYARWIIIIGDSPEDHHYWKTDPCSTPLATAAATTAAVAAATTAAVAAATAAATTAAVAAATTATITTATAATTTTAAAATTAAQ